MNMVSWRIGLIPVWVGPIMLEEVSMAAGAFIPISEYLRTSYRPDCNYIDGEVQERNVGTQNHSDLVAQLVLLLATDTNMVHVRVNAALRMQVKQTRFRVPDICVRRRSAPSEQIVHTPPLLCAEVLSPEDTLSRTREAVKDYLEMGVPEVWVLDPATRCAMIFREGTATTIVAQTEGSLTIPETSVKLALSDIFKLMDDY